MKKIALITTKNVKRVIWAFGFFLLAFANLVVFARNGSTMSLFMVAACALAAIEISRNGLA